MARIKLAKTAVASAQPQAKNIALRNTVVPGFLCKKHPEGRPGVHAPVPHELRVVPQPSLGLFGAQTMEQAPIAAGRNSRVALTK